MILSVFNTHWFQLHKCRDFLYFFVYDNKLIILWVFETLSPTKQAIGKYHFRFWGKCIVRIFYFTIFLHFMGEKNIN